jgi:hypothetical protein
MCYYGDNVNTFPFWRAISKSRRSANRVLSQPRIYRLAFKSEDSEDALVNTAQWFTRDEPTNRSKADPAVGNISLHLFISEHRVQERNHTVPWI